MGGTLYPTEARRGVCRYDIGVLPRGDCKRGLCLDKNQNKMRSRWGVIIGVKIGGGEGRGRVRERVGLGRVFGTWTRTWH